MRALVTGSAGFVGRHMVEALTARGYWVQPCDIADPRDFYKRDCRDLFGNSVSLLKTLECKPHYDLVVHCAATVGGREGIDFNAAMLAANNLSLDGTMFEWALKTRPGRVVYFSSAAAYPTSLQDGHSKLRLVESDCNVFRGLPDETYGWAKLTGELTAQRVRQAGVPVTVVRPFSSYDYDQDDCYPFSTFAHRAARRDDPFDVWGDGTQTRDFIHVDDLVQAILALVEDQVDGPVNLGTGRATSMDDLARLFMREAGYEAPIRHLLDKPVGVAHRVCDNSLLRRYFTPRITVEEGVRRALRLLAESELKQAA